jgi:hypothetical protein
MGEISFTPFYGSRSAKDTWAAIAGARTGLSTSPRGGTARPAIGEPPQQGVELRALARGERREELSLDARGHSAGFDETGAAGIGEMHGVGAPIGRSRPPLHKSLRLQLVDEIHHCRLIGVHDLDELTLTEVATIGEQSRDGELGDVQVQGPQRLVVRQAQSAVRALEQEAGPIGGGSLTHAVIVPDRTICR